MKGLLMTRENAEKTAKGLKTQTRRTAGLEKVNVHPDEWIYDGSFLSGDGNYYHTFLPTNGDLVKTVFLKPRYLPGETVYLKEGWKIYDLDTQTINNNYLHVKVQYVDGMIAWGHVKNGTKFTIPDTWHSSMFLQATAARHFYKIKDARPERLQQISESDALDEGIDTESETYAIAEHNQNAGVSGCGNVVYSRSYYPSICCFAELWDSINGKKKGYAWKDNPWVWRYELKPLIPDERE